MSFTLQNAIIETRRHLKDNTESVWTNDDITAFINEALMLIKADLPEFLLI